MRTFAQKPKVPQQATPAKSTILGRAHFGQSYEVNSILHLQRTIGNHAVQRLLQANAEELAAGSATTASTHFEHDFSRIRVHPPAAGSIQTKLAINKPGDEYEQEADDVAEQMMRMPEPQLQRDCACGGGCPKCQTEQPGQEHERLQTKCVESSASEPTAVPPIVHDVLRSAGQPLNPATRAFMEPRFDHDFSQVLVHTDSKAAESARDLNANAYTVGRNIVFGAGQFLPGTQVGWRLLSHELTHVVQQRRSPVPVASGLSVAGDFHERQAGAVADALMRGGDITGLVDSGSGPACPPLQRDTAHGTSPSRAQPTTAPPPPRPLDYDRTPFRLPLVPQGHTAASVTTLLNGKVKAGDIASFAVKGVRSGSNAEIFLLIVIYHLGQKTRWGTEADIVTAIDWPAKPGGPPPQGRVTVRIDSQGAASAELLTAGPIPAVAQTTVAAGSAKLIADFGFAAVTGWSGQNPTRDAAEISDVLAALELLKSRAPQDIPALKGVELIRVSSLGGQTAGEFSVGGTAGKKPWLKLADRAFGTEESQFFGGGPGSPTVPASFQVILHEVGHAVEREEFRVAMEGYVKASAELDAARKLVAGDPAKYDAEFQEAKRKGKLPEFWKKQEATHKKNEEAERKAAAHLQQETSKVESTEVAASTVQPLETEAATMRTSAANALTVAKGAVQALRADEVQSSAAYVKAVEDTAAAITSFTVDAKAGLGVIDDLELVVFQKAGDRDKTRFELLKVQRPTHRAIFPLDRAVEAQDAWFEAERVLARARRRTRRLQKFIDLVTANNIRRFTQYSVSNWQLKPEEFYAEAYSLWLVDSEFLRTNYKVVYDFFQSGDYRK
jgi:hypothetical protein